MDITERKHVEDKIREQEAELRQIQDAAPRHLSELRSDGSHLYINQSSFDYTNLQPVSTLKASHVSSTHASEEEHSNAGKVKPCSIPFLHCTTNALPGYYPDDRRQRAVIHERSGLFCFPGLQT